jgi:hypothetical protein
VKGTFIRRISRGSYPLGQAIEFTLNAISTMMPKVFFEFLRPMVLNQDLHEKPRDQE